MSNPLRVTELKRLVLSGQAKDAIRSLEQCAAPVTMTFALAMALGEPTEAQREFLELIGRYGNEGCWES